jgi:cysteine-S-conjugate beta-lyase
MHSFVDALQLFGLGVSWGGFESLVIPFAPSGDHTAARWPWRGQALRLHVGLEDPRDLIADLDQALVAMSRRLRAA